MSDYNEELVAYTPAQLAEAEFPMVAMRSNDDEELVVVQVVAFAKGWATLENDDGNQTKCRASELFPMEEEATESGGKMAKVLAKYRTKYVASVAASGKKSLHNGDPVAKALEYRELEWLYAATAGVLQLEVSELKARYAHLNLGSQRMNLGNRIRAAYKRGDEAVVVWVHAELRDLSQQ